MASPRVNYDVGEPTHEGAVDDGDNPTIGQFHLILEGRDLAGAVCLLGLGTMLSQFTDHVVTMVSVDVVMGVVAIQDLSGDFLADIVSAHRCYYLLLDGFVKLDSAKNPIHLILRGKVATGVVDIVPAILALVLAEPLATRAEQPTTHVTDLLAHDQTSYFFPVMTFTTVAPSPKAARISYFSSSVGT